MTDANQVRINELARELEVKAKAIIDLLPGFGVTEKKTHSSSIPVDVAEKVRRTIQGQAQADAAAESAAVAEKQAREAAARAARQRPAATPATPPVSAPPVSSAPSAPATAATKPASPAPAVVAPQPGGQQPPVAPAAAAPAAPQAAPKPAAPAPAPTQPIAPSVAKPSSSAAPQVPAPSGAKPAPAPSHGQPLRPASQTSGAPPAQRPASPGQQRPGQPAAARPAAGTSARPGTQPQRPLPTGNRGPLPTGNRGPMPTGNRGPLPSGDRPSGPRPGQPMRPNQPIRPQQGAAGGQNRPYSPRPTGPGGPSGPQNRPYGQRPGAVPTGTRPGPRQPGRPGMLPPPPPDRMPSKAEPGKPLYTRRPTQRQRPISDKREMEGERKLHPTRQRPGAGDRRSLMPVAPPEPRAPRDINITEGITIRELAEKLDVRAKDLLKVLLDKGIFASINQALDSPTATQLAEAFNGVVTVLAFEDEMMLEVAKEETKENLKPRPPVVTVMGHVDHGKTSLLDAIRSEDVAAGEAGGITQHIGAYKIQVNDRAVVFVDTPGHEAFTRMRARGAKVTDIVVLVVAADDGVMPQTKEAIDHARAANVPIIVAVNKIDKPEAQPERVKRQLSDLGLVTAEWGGDTEFVEVSAKQKKGLDRLLEIILLVADLRELKANPDAPGSGTVLESRVDKGRGPVATILIQNGTLRSSDFFICGAVFGKVRALFDDHGRTIKEAGPSTPVEVLGLQGVPEAGDHFQVTDEAKARHIVDYRQGKQRDAQLRASAGGRITLDQLHEQLKTGEVKELGVVIKADVQGSVEVLKSTLQKLSTDRVKVKVIRSGVGAITESDVLLGSATQAGSSSSAVVIIGFNVRPEARAADVAKQEGVDIRLHSIIYKVEEEIRAAMIGMLEAIEKEKIIGKADVREVFRVPKAGSVAGCMVIDGSVRRNARARLIRDGVVSWEGNIGSLRRFKDDVSEVREGFECGISLENFNDIKVGDQIEAYVVERVAATEL